MKYKAKIKAETTAVMTVWLHEDIHGNKTIEGIEEVEVYQHHD
jgi:hypothetical protein